MTVQHDFSDISSVDEQSFDYIYEQNVSIPLKTGGTVIRANVYRPKTKDAKYPVLVTYGPYGKDIPYKDFHGKSFSEVNPEHKSTHSCWETPDPKFWTGHGYVIVRADERGTGQSPGVLDTMSCGTSEAFVDVIEWSADQDWSNGKVGLLGISYYAGSQWRVAARRPRGLAAIVPWEGISDYYRDRCRHGGIYANGFINFWWNRQVVTNQYGRPGQFAAGWGPDTIEGDLPEEALVKARNDQTLDNASNQFRDQEYYASKEYALEDIQVPLLSVANWGGITVHLRGNVEGFYHAGSKLKYLRFITGRHDLPLYYQHEVELQRSFLDAFLKGEDRVGWSKPGTVPPIDLVLRKGDIGVNNTEIEQHAFKRRHEQEWPIARTVYTRYYCTPDGRLETQAPTIDGFDRLTYRALGSEKSPELFRFSTPAFEHETEITGHVTAHISISAEGIPGGACPSDIDLFLTLRHFGPSGKEILYTGSAGDGVPLCKGWLRVSMRKVNTSSPRNRPWLPQRDYLSTDKLPVLPGEVYSCDVELWPTNVIVEAGGKIVLEVSSGDTANSGLFRHDHPDDRPQSIFEGKNHIRFGPHWQNYVTLPIIPPKKGEH